MQMLSNCFFLSLIDFEFLLKIVIAKILFMQKFMLKAYAKKPSFFLHFIVTTALQVTH